MDQKTRIIKIINEELKKFDKELSFYIDNSKFKEAKIAAKTIKRLQVMIIRIQSEV